jgi:hypothetical protein
MSRSVCASLGLVVTITIGGCAFWRHKPPPQVAQPLETGGILTIAAGVPVVARSVQPIGFEPLAYHPPIWLNQGRDVALVGSLHGRTTLVDFGIGPQQPVVLASDTADAVISDVVPNPDGSELAVTLAHDGGRRIEVVRFDIATHQKSSLATLDRGFDTLSMGWPTADTIALAINEPAPPKDAQAPQPGSDPPAPAAAAFELYLIPVQTQRAPTRVKFNCALSPLSWDPNGSYAVGQGEGSAPPVILDLDRRRCAPLNVPGPINVLAWAPKGASFIFAGPAPGGSVTSVFQFDIASAHSSPVAISSSAAAYVSDTSMVALGSRGLTLDRALAERQSQVTAEVALMDPGQGLLKISTLGVPTFPEMLAASTMVYSPNPATAAIELYAPGGVAPMRYIVAFSARNQRETLLASGPATGLVLMAWSPDGETLALFHGNASVSELTLVVPGSATQTAQPPSFPAGAS